MRLRYSLRKIVELFANSGDPDQTACSKVVKKGISSMFFFFLFVCGGSFTAVNTVKVMSSWSVNLNTLFLGRL